MLRGSVCNTDPYSHVLNVCEVLLCRDVVELQGGVLPLLYLGDLSLVGERCQDNTFTLGKDSFACCLYEDGVAYGLLGMAQQQLPRHPYSVQPERGCGAQARGYMHDAAAWQAVDVKSESVRPAPTISGDVAILVVQGLAGTAA